MTDFKLIGDSTAWLEWALSPRVEPASSPHGRKAGRTFNLGTAATERRKQEAYAGRQARYEEAAQLKAVGLSISAIAKQIGADRKTIIGWLRAGAAPLWRKPPNAMVATRRSSRRSRQSGCS
jgi:hypothetical protein